MPIMRIANIWSKRISPWSSTRFSGVAKVLFLMSFLLQASALERGRLPGTIFFSDLESGPSSGGENNKGAYVTIYGKNFGSTRFPCAVTVGGGAVDNYPIWSESKITFQLGPRARSGAIVVDCPQGSSNSVPFTVRPGSVFFVATNGSDGNSGIFTRPWHTLVQAKNSMRPGDITYAMEGVSQTTMDNYGAALNIESGGTPGNPIAMVAYPRATVTVGAVSGLPIGLRVPNTARAIKVDNWVIAGLVIRGQLAALHLGGSGNPATENWRLIGNDISCPNGNGPAACAGTSKASNVKFLGNVVHEVGLGSGSKLYHGVYFADSNNIEVGWNHIYNIRGCRGIQFHSTPLTRDGTTGLNEYNLIVHDNVIHDVRCDAINFATVDPSRGPVQAYNNIIYRVGTGPHPLDGPADYACFFVPGATNVGPRASGRVDIVNNTCYDAGSVSATYGGAGLISGPSNNSSLTVNYRNNIFYSVHNEPYMSLATLAMGGGQKISGSNNLWYGNGPGPAAPAQLLNSINADPAFVDAQASDFHLQARSPAIRAGVNSVVATDHDGVARPLGTICDVGAFQFCPPSPIPPGTR